MFSRFQRNQQPNQPNQRPYPQSQANRGSRTSPQNNYNNPYYIPPKDSFKVTTKKVRIIEAIMILIPIVIGLIFFSLTFQVHARDNQKEDDLDQIIQALRLFYINSSNVEASRVYPIALNSQLNEIDFEYTLRRHLTGQTSLDRHAYIPSNKFPTDPWGVYSKDFTDRPVPYNRLDKLPFGTEQVEYIEGYSSCNFNPSQEKFSRCYLYTSSGNGESFQLAYYSEVREGFVIYSEARNNSEKASITFTEI